MPREVFTLSEAAALGHVITARCGGCGRRRHYAPEDWQQLLGDVACAEVERQLSCSRCGTAEFLRVRFDRPPAGVRQAMKLRRIREIRMVRKVIWSDEDD
jgi:hypothetical protein